MNSPTGADLRLLPPAVAAWLACFLVVAIPDAAWPAAIGGALVCCTLVAVARRSTGARGTVAAVGALAALGAALACTVVALQAPGRTPTELAEAADSRRFVTALVVVGEPAAEGGRYRGVVETVEVGGRTTAVHSPVLVFDGMPDDGIGIGIGIGATVRLTGTLAATEPGDDVAFLFFASGTPLQVRDAPAPLVLANALRSGFAAAATELPGDGGDLLPGLSIGDTSAVDSRLDASMKATSLSHLTAVSGANCAVVIGIIMVAGGLLGMSRRWRVVASLATLAGFVVLVTPQPSVIRAAVMAALVLGALAAGRPVRGIPVLSLAVLLLVIADPWLSHSYGFVLSVLATGGLLLLAGPLAAWLAHWMPHPLAAVVAVPLAAQLACQPVLVLLNPSIPVYGVVANLLAEPAAPIATVVGLLACLALPVAPPVGDLLAAVAWLPSAWIAAVAGFFAGLPGAQLPWPGGGPGAVLLVVITTAAIVGVLARGRVRRVAAAATVLLLVSLAGAAVGTRLVAQLSMPADWQVAACDIGQGDAVLVRSAGATALVDTGPDPALLRSCLERLGIQHIDLLVLTHFDLDHVGGVDAVVGRVDRVLTGPTGGPDDERTLERLTADGAAVDHVARGAEGALGDHRWRVLWPAPRSTDSGNEASVALVLDPVGNCPSGCLSALFLGDLGEAAQAAMLASARVPRVDVVKVSHHGSADQSERLYARADATVGVIGVGVDNGYGHPSPELLAILASTGTAVTRTDEQGLVLLAPGEEGITVWTERRAPSGDGAEP